VVEKYEDYINDKTSYRTNHREYSGRELWFAGLPPEEQQFAFELWKLIHRNGRQACD
jgi:hypothetical protein